MHRARGGRLCLRQQGEYGVQPDLHSLGDQFSRVIGVMIGAALVV